MQFEDARERVAAAEDLLLSRREELGLAELTLHSLAAFLEDAERQPLSARQKELLVDQATLVMEQLYAHLPFKRARYGVDPVQRLRLLRVRAGSMSERGFHSELLEIFVSVRDAHTFYGLPDPYRGAMAFLPFEVVWFADEGDPPRRRFLVSSVMEGFKHPYFAPTAEILAWNGIPMDRAVLAVAELEAGGNDAAMFARGLEAMTLRPLTFSLPPSEHYVVIEYLAARGKRGGREARGIILPWTVARGFGQTIFQSGQAMSVADSRVQMRNAQKLLWCREELLREYRSRDDFETIAGGGLNLSFYESPNPPDDEASPATRGDLERDSILPASLEFCFADSQEGDSGIDPSSLRLKGKFQRQRFGYLRIKNFSAGAGDQESDPEVFFTEFQRILGLMRKRAPDGIILDLRGNPGGSIQDAERLLQLFTPREIHPETFHLANTLLLQQLTNQVLQKLRNLNVESDSPEDVLVVSRASAELGVASADVEGRVVSGAALADGEPLSDRETVNEVGQRYHGPVVLLVDARTYSAADIFSAGFQDHAIGEVIGEDANTGGGGASRWTHQEDLVEVFGKIPRSPFHELPRKATLAVAIRRCTRQGGRTAGQALEDTGVQSDLVHQRTRDDVLLKSRDLLQFACTRLAGRPTYTLDAQIVQHDSSRWKVAVKTVNLTRIEFLVDGRPQKSCAVPRVCSREYTVPLQGLPPGAGSVLTVYGLAKVDFSGALDADGELTHVATTRVRLEEVE